MKKVLYLFGLTMLLGAAQCGGEKEEVDVDCTGSTYQNHSLRLGPKGGCYYNNSNGNKTYVDRSFCKC